MLIFRMLKEIMLLCRNAEGVHGQKKVGNPCARAYDYVSEDTQRPCENLMNHI